MKFISIIPLTIPIVPLFAADLSMVDIDDIEFLSQVEMNIEANTPHEDVIEHYAVPYTGPSNMDEVDPNTLHGKVMAGYQGWHRAAGDKAPLAWDMWAMGELSEQDARFDFWPDMSEYSEEEKYETPFKHTDGSPAYLYSAYNRKTVFRHFQWMKDYGIDGAFPQRFSGYLIDPKTPMTAPRNKSRLGTLSHVREAANYYGRSYAVMYDVHCDEADWEKILHDWDILKNKMKLTDDPAYQKHDGKYVIAIWGFLKPDRRFDLEATRRAFDLLKNSERYGPCTIIIGVDNEWSTPNYKGKGMHAGKVNQEYFKMADFILPWKVAERNKADLEDNMVRLARDLDWCERNNIEYFPVVSPGFSWRNKQIKRDPDVPHAESEYAPRYDGELFAEKITIAKKTGVKQIYVAMFDEVDEGTAIYKCTTNPPVSENHIFVPYRVPSDHYLKMTGDASKLFKDQMSLKEFRASYIIKNHLNLDYD